MKKDKKPEKSITRVRSEQVIGYNKRQGRIVSSVHEVYVAFADGSVGKRYQKYHHSQDGTTFSPTWYSKRRYRFNTPADQVK